MAKESWIKIAAVTMMVALSSCSRDKSAESTEQMREKESNQGTVIDFCFLKSKAADSIAEYVMRDSASLTPGALADDNCVTETIVALVKTPSWKSLQALEIMSAKSDGYLAEYIADEAVHLLENNGAQTLTFLSVNQDGALFQLLIDGLSMKCNMENVSQNELQSKFNSSLTTDLQRKMLNEVFRNVDPKKFD